MTLAAGEVLQASRAALRHVTFPIDCIVSLRATVDGEHTLDAGLVGREGLVGIELAWGADSASTQALVLSAGPALRMDAQAFGHHLRQSAALQSVVNRYAHASMSELARTLACTHTHRVSARLAGRLLMIGDRTRASGLRITHEALAHMLGTRRVSITAAATLLRERKLIRCQRGEISIIDRQGLVAMACSCCVPIA